jgi:hypothetical protein
MDTNEWDPERVGAALRSRPPGSLSDESYMGALATRALFLLGRGHAGLQPDFAAFYPRLVEHVGTGARRQIFERARDHARSGLLRSDVLTHLLCLETDRVIVAEAAFEVARIGVPAPASSARGADYVLELVVTSAVANAGAALGGLLALADCAVNRKLALLRPALALPDADAALAEMGHYAHAHVHVATVEFWLDWMESLVVDLPAAQRAFDRAAAALLAQRQAARGDVVFDGSWIAPWDDAPVQGSPRVRELPLSRFAATVAARLAALAAAAPRSADLRRALAAWTLVH